MAVDRFIDQMGKAGLVPADLADARMVIGRLPGEASGQVYGRMHTGIRMGFHVSATSTGGRRYERRRVLFVVPNHITARITGPHADEFSVTDSGPRLIEPFGTFEIGIAFRGRGDHGHGHGSYALLELTYSAERPPIVFTLYGGCLYTSAVDSDPLGDDADVIHIADVSAVAQPNPTRGAFSVRYRLRGAAHVRLGVYDALGRCVRTLDLGDAPAGSGSCAVDLADQPSGTYFARLTGGDTAVAVPVVLAR